MYIIEKTVMHARTHAHTICHTQSVNQLVISLDSVDGSGCHLFPSALPTQCYLLNSQHICPERNAKEDKQTT